MSNLVQAGYQHERENWKEIQKNMKTNHKINHLVHNEIVYLENILISSIGCILRNIPLKCLL